MINIINIDPQKTKLSNFIGKNSYSHFQDLISKNKIELVSNSQQNKTTLSSKHLQDKVSLSEKNYLVVTFHQQFGNFPIFAISQLDNQHNPTFMSNNENIQFIGFNNIEINLESHPKTFPRFRERSTITKVHLIFLPFPS